MCVCVCVYVTLGQIDILEHSSAVVQMLKFVLHGSFDMRSFISSVLVLCLVDVKNESYELLAEFLLVH